MKKKTIIMLALAASLQAAGQTTITLTVDTACHQTITGFGAAALEHLMRPTQDVEIIRKAYESDSPIGLNILRMEMSPNLKGDISKEDIGWDTPYDWHGQLDAVREAKRHGAIILATPWSPPAAYKTNGKTSGGQEDGVHGKLKNPEKLFTWFNTFLAYMKNNNAAVDVVSIQNEPDWWVSYSGCEYTPQEQVDLVKTYAKRLQKSTYGVRLMSAEPLGYNPEYYSALMEDEEAAKYIDLFGGHVYGNYQCMKNIATVSALAGGREVWMTEHTVNPRGDSQGVRDLPTWHEELLFCEDVNECLVNGCTAYVYWYLCKQYGLIGDGDLYDKATCLTPGNDRGKILTRGYLMGQFARHLKGATRLSATSNLANGKNTPGVNQLFETSAFIKGDSIIVNVIDTMPRQFYFQMNLPAKALSVKRIQSTEGSLCQETDIADFQPGTQFTDLLPQRSFTTYIFRIDPLTLPVETPRAQMRKAQPSDMTYNLQGQRVAADYQGIVVRGGRKFFQHAR